MPGRVEFGHACIGVRYNAIFLTVVRIALGDRQRGQLVQLASVWELFGRIQVESRPHAIQHHLSPIEGWSSCDDSIIGGRITLSEHGALSATLRATVPVRVRRRLFIGILDKVLRDDCLIVQ